MQPEQQRDKQQTEQRQRQESSFQNAAYCKAPPSPRKMVHHGDAKTAQRDAEPEQIRIKVGREERGRREERAEKGHCAQDATDQQGALPRLRSAAVLLSVHGLAPAARARSGTPCGFASAVAASGCVACKARI